MKTNTILIIVTAIIAVAGAYWYYFARTGNEPSLTASDTENIAMVRFQTLASELESISFDTRIFSEPNFMALIDLTTPIIPETVGRTDPFAPIPGVNDK
jgi:hypothetical protein